MSEPPLTISAIAGLEPEASGFPFSREEREAFSERLTALVREVPVLAPFDMGPRLLEFLRESLHTPLTDLIEEMWRQRKELADVTASGTAEKPVLGEVALHEHEMSLTLHPAAELFMDSVKVATLAFDVETTLKLEAVHVVMRNAHITGFTAGRLTAAVTVEFKGLPVMPKKERTIDLSREFRLPHGGIPLVGARRETVGVVPVAS